MTRSTLLVPLAHLGDRVEGASDLIGDPQRGGDPQLLLELLPLLRGQPPSPREHDEVFGSAAVTIHGLLG
jgi:hypothetical protein